MVKQKMNALKYIDIIQNKTKNNHRLTITIFNKLFEELPLQLSTIKEALNTRDYKLAEDTVHHLRGSAAFCDLEEIKKPAFALEHCLMNKDYEAVFQHFQLLEDSTLHFTSYRKAILAML